MKKTLIILFFLAFGSASYAAAPEIKKAAEIDLRFLAAEKTVNPSYMCGQWEQGPGTCMVRKCTNLTDCNTHPDDCGGPNEIWDINCPDLP